MKVTKQEKKWLRVLPLPWTKIPRGLLYCMVATGVAFIEDNVVFPTPMGMWIKEQ